MREIGEMGVTALETLIGQAKMGLRNPHISDEMLITVVDAIYRAETVLADVLDPLDEASDDRIPDSRYPVCSICDLTVIQPSYGSLKCPSCQREYAPLEGSADE